MAYQGLVRGEADGQGADQDERGLPQGVTADEEEVALDEPQNGHVDQVDSVRAVGEVAQDGA